MPDRKSWRELSGNEVSSIKIHQCSKCKYYSKLIPGAYKTNATCDYLLIEGHSRGCDPRDCVKFGLFKAKQKDTPKRVARISL